MSRDLVLGALLAVTAMPVAAQQSVTIYSDGRILMRSTVPSQVPSGNSTHRVSAGFLDAGSVFSLDSAVAIMGASYDAAVDEANTLRRAIGRKLVFETYTIPVLFGVVISPERKHWINRTCQIEDRSVQIAACTISIS